MKRKNISADTALLEVARRHNTTVDEVRKEIRIAMAVAMCSPDPDVQKRWREIPHGAEVLTPEDFIAYAEMPGEVVSCFTHLIVMFASDAFCTGVSMGW